MSNYSMSRPPHVSKKAVTGEPPAMLLSAAAQETTATTVQSSNAVKKPPRELRRLPPISSGGGGARANSRRNNGTSATAGSDLAERTAKAWIRHALAKRVATRMLKRSTSSPPLVAVADEGSSQKKAIACCCARLPPGLCCAVHQDGAPGRAWMRAQRRGGGRECGEAVAVARPRRTGGRSASTRGGAGMSGCLAGSTWSASRPRSTVQRQSGFVS